MQGHGKISVSPWAAVNRSEYKSATRVLDTGREKKIVLKYEFRCSDSLPVETSDLHFVPRHGRAWSRHSAKHGLRNVRTRDRSRVLCGSRHEHRSACVFSHKKWFENDLVGQVPSMRNGGVSAALQSIGDSGRVKPEAARSIHGALVRGGIKQQYRIQ